MIITFMSLAKNAVRQTGFPFKSTENQRKQPAANDRYTFQANLF